MHIVDMVMQTGKTVDSPRRFECDKKRVLTSEWVRPKFRAECFSATATNLLGVDGQPNSIPSCILLLCRLYRSGIPVQWRAYASLVRFVLVLPEMTFNVLLLTSTILPRNAPWFMYKSC